MSKFSTAEHWGESPMSRFWKTGQFSDVKVRALDKNGDAKTYNLHKIVLCGKSEFFYNALCKGQWKETAEGVVDMTADHPGVVEAILKYMYLDDYDHWHESDVSFEDKLMDHARIHAAAIKYCVEGLPENSARNFEYVLEDEVDEENQAKALLQLIPFLDAEIPENTYSGVRECLAHFVANNLGDLLLRVAYRQLLADHGRFAVSVFDYIQAEKNQEKNRKTGARAVTWSVANGCRCQGGQSHQW